MDEFTMKAVTFTSALTNAYRDAEEREEYPKLELNNEDMTEDFTAMLHALLAFYKKLTGDDDLDIIGFTHILNRLAIQSIMQKNRKEVNEL